MPEQPCEYLSLQPWMTAPETVAVLDALTAGGWPARFVGGCVRDAVIGRPVKDVDIATPADPQTVMNLIEKAGLRAVPTGIGHGTVTAVSGHRPYEITTLRCDVETFGRHARVAFTKDWREDAARRDLTINALFCDREGGLYDYFGGLADLRAGRVRFVGDARQRIAEDYLRLLRFFRFHAHFGRGVPDTEALAAATEAAPKLALLSGERVRDELLRLLAAENPVPVLRVMHVHRILATELPEAGPPDALERLLPLEPADADPLLRLAAILETDAAGAQAVAERLRLSNRQRQRLVWLVAPPCRITGTLSRQALREACYRHGRELIADLLRLDAARRNDTSLLQAALAVVADWRPRDFPLRGRDLIARGVPRGPELGRHLAALEAWWVREDFAPDRDELLKKLEETLASTGR